ncbi:alpha-L-rhamnosidase [Nonomuraea jiangxiensis]|uniref:alpha-L-rhamnosidase n=1 Tax=Nonomuraea jiangxiensis TaxID=633440 RepID=A0A1G8TJX9_9ACTN|nr:alpha-L-rhamnosidase [Nonomuraea jiangxiensis]SDJ41831.1 alpha-L-rhamnosidase [Nonomuraea jiangxiensis]
MGSPRAYGLRCDHRTTPFGVDGAPLLAWRLAGEDPVGCVVEVDGVWSSGRIEDAAAIHVRYAGPPLRARTRYAWRVTLWAADGTSSTARSWFETGTDRWTAAWIAADPDAVEYVDPPTEGDLALSDHGLLPCPQLRRAFQVRPAVAAARLYISAKGLYEAGLNGRRVGDAQLAPGWTDYRQRIPYQTYDVTDLIAEEENVLAVTLADGWWSGFVGFDPRRPGSHYGRFPELIAELHLDYADGSTQVVVTDGAWRTARGHLAYADLLKGECHDERAATPGWQLPGFDDSSWRPVVVTGHDHAPLVPSPDEPVRALRELAPVAVTRTGPRTHLVDFGQNLAGRVRLAVEEPAPGTRVTIRHAETLDAEGGLDVANLRTADATDVLISAGQTVVFEPAFTYHGFRYAEITGVEDLGDVHAVVLHSDTPAAGTFVCSDPEIDQLQRNIEWGQRGNFVSVPTDCPQRDERLGWLADAQVFLPTACFNADVAAFFVKWLRDVRDAQRPEGGFPNVAPRISGVADEGAPGWADAGVLIPWHLYRVYGDERFLDVDSMAGWVEFVRRHNPDLIWRAKTGPHFADWLAPGAATPRDLLATAFFHRSADLTARAAVVTGRTADAERLRALADDIRTAFIKTFVSAPGRLAGDTQTGYLLALAFGLLPGEWEEPAVRRLAELVEEHGPQTGFLGVNLLCPVLSAHGRADLAHALLRRTDPPSWLYQVRQGATTIWERWDGAGAPSMNSFNHYAFGSIGEWLYGGVAGIAQAPDSVAFRELVIRPQPGDLAWARATYESARGHVAVSWERAEGDFRLSVTIPPGATATVHLPDGQTHQVLSGDHTFRTTEET